MPNKNKSISIVIPIYGSFDERRAIASVGSILNQKDVDLEVVISEQGIVPKFPSIDDSRVKHIFNKHVPQENLSDFNPGRVRNIAIEQSTKEFLYTNDADVVFLNEYFLSKSLGLLEQDEFLSIKRPPMKRLPLDNFEKFWNIYTKNGIEDVLSKLDFGQDYFATLDGITRGVKAVTKPSDENYDKTFVAYMEDFQRYLSDDSLKGQEPKIWTENKHCGGNLLRRKHFEEVGKYCESFINWGCEDSDLQWKLSEMYTNKLYPVADDFMVLHLDHPKGYFSPEMWAKNEKICSERKMKGISYAIQEDKDER